MKKNLFPLFLALLVLSSCSKDEIANSSEKDAKVFTVSLGFSGEITSITSSPLNASAPSVTLRSANATTVDLYGIQVYATPTSGGSETPYAYGLFDNLDSMKIKLMDGYKYRFECGMVPDGKNVLSGGYGNSFNAPFRTSNDNGSATEYTLSTFKYSNSKSMTGLNSGHVFNGTASLSWARPGMDRYYGTYSDYVPNEGGSVSINMKRMVFGVTVVAEGLTNGKLQIQISGAPQMEFAAPTTSSSNNIFTFANVGSPFASGTTDDYFEDIPVTFTWVKSDGVPVPIATNQTIRFTRNKLTTITVKIQDNNLNNGIGIILENTNMVTGDSINITGGTGTDTPIN